jgi:SAM-dependent methyltransferase
MISRLWYNFLKNIGKWPCARNMESIEIFNGLYGKGLDIGHDGEYTFKSDNITRLNIYPGENIDVVYDGDIIPFEDKTFDKILLRCILEHVNNPDSLLKEASRTLKENGVMVIEVPFINPIHAAPIDNFRFTPNGLKIILSAQNLQIDSIFYTEDHNWAIKWLLWQRLKECDEVGLKYLLKFAFLKYFINPLFLRSTTPNEKNFSQFGCIVKKVTYT